MLGRAVRRGGRPGLLGTAARTAVVAGTATAVSGRVSRRQADRYAGQQVEAEPPQEQAPAPAPAAAAPGGSGLSEEDLNGLERLAALHQQGVLSDQELAAAKARILGI
ncbi:SHOCT domain-containing protein [Kitasatospora sp. NBC_01287]|uniref:SHOCT domain-containing protein n=1 Tax=Kitasatospora sp. NBC_01287 TaxID=2903573 RepID=UPI002257ACCD|nr:SHOCT domain-containing protein [Kitasatospora sp. NBC_01287]MCX4750392.1 SHOCT domain-containing protein [Kitasatospora sp. NBC_01287]